MERFTLDGWTYYQQGRRCGRPGCRCQRGELHGPYWYRRHALSGAVEYAGRRSCGRFGWPAYRGTWCGHGRVGATWSGN